MRTLQTSLRAVLAAGVLFAALLSVARPALAGGGKEDEAKARLKTLNDLTALEAEGLKPWYLKMDVQLYNPPSPDALPGAPSTPGEVGTVEEWWASPTQYRIVYTTPSYRAVEGQNASGRYRSADFKPVPAQLEAARREVVHPMPTEAEAVDQMLELRKQDFGGGSFECLILGRAVLHVPYPPVGTFPSFCTKAGTNDLVATIDNGREFLVRPGAAVFQKRNTATIVAAKAGGVDVMRAKVERLGEIVPTDANFAAPSDAEKIAGGEPVAVPASVMRGELEHKVSPVTESSRQRPQGTFTARVLIGTDGHVVQCHTVSGTADIIGPSTTAIYGYVYKPYLVNGKPNEVLTTVSIEY